MLQNTNYVAKQKLSKILNHGIGQLILVTDKHLGEAGRVTYFHCPTFVSSK